MSDITRRARYTYDVHAKNILKEKNILVHIIKALVPEFRDMPVQDIRKYIGNDPDNVDSDLIPQSGAGNQFGDEDGVISTDIKFNLTLPDNQKTDVSFLIQIDIEPQNENEEYKPVQRGIYYASRMIAGQHGETFSHSDYHKIQQVYSIWICFNPPKEEEGTVRLYNMKEENIIGDYKEDRKKYDLMKIVVINLDRKQIKDGSAKVRGEYYNEDVENTLRILNTIFKSQEPADRIIEEIRGYGVKTTDTMGTEVDDMAFVGDAPYTQGRNEGREEGFAQGLSQGIDSEKIDTAMRMIAKGSYIEEEIADISGLPIERIRELKHSTNT